MIVLLVHHLPNDLHPLLLKRFDHWQTEAVIYLMVGATLLGLPYVQKLKGHVNVDLVPCFCRLWQGSVLMIASYLQRRDSCCT